MLPSLLILLFASLSAGAYADNLPEECDDPNDPICGNFIPTGPEPVQSTIPSPIIDTHTNPTVRPQKAEVVVPSILRPKPEPKKPIKPMKGRVDAHGNTILDASEWEDEKVGAREQDRVVIRVRKSSSSGVCSEERDAVYNLMNVNTDKMTDAEVKKLTAAIDKAEAALMGCYDKIDAVETIVQKQEEVLECPKDFKAIDQLAKIQADYDKAPKNENLSELIINPINVESSRFEAHMPFGCGFDSAANKFFDKRAFFCVDDVTCFSQGNQYTPKNLYRNKRIDGQTNLYKGSVYNDKGNRRNPSKLGLGRYIPLSKSIYLESYRRDDGSMYYGLIFVPTAARYMAKACELEKAKGPQNQINKLIGQADALEELLRLSKHLAKNRRSMSPAEVSALENQAFSLSDIVKGLATSFRTPSTASACAALKATK